MHTGLVLSAAYMWDFKITVATFIFDAFNTQVEGIHFIFKMGSFAADILLPSYFLRRVVVVEIQIDDLSVLLTRCDW